MFQHQPVEKNLHANIIQRMAAEVDDLSNWQNAGEVVETLVACNVKLNDARYIHKKIWFIFHTSL